MECHIGVISGDGIGPEIVAEAKKVLDKAGEKYGHSFTYQDILMGGCSIDATGVPLTDEAIAAAKASDAVLMGSIGGNTQTGSGIKTGSRTVKTEKVFEFICKFKTCLFI